MKQKYTLLENTPMKFYRFLCALLPFSCVLGTLYFFYTLATTYVYHESPWFWLDISLRIIMLILVYMSSIFLRRKEWRGVQCLLLYGCVICISKLILDYLDNASIGTYIGRVLGTMIIFVPVYIYFRKRRLLFSPISAAIPSDKPIDDSIPEETPTKSPVEPKKPIFERYDTYITCPGCGSLVPKGTKQCECGYDLSGPASRIGRRLRRAVPILLCLLLIIAGTTIGYYAGQKSMDSKLDAQYDAGYERGVTNGYAEGHSIGYSDGLKRGLSQSSVNYSKIFEDAYRTALSDNATGTYGRDNAIMQFIKFDFPDREQLHQKLAESYGFKPAQ